MSLDLGGILKVAVPLAATAFGGPVAGMAAGALFGGGAKGPEGVNQLTSLFGAGGGRPPMLTGMQPDLARQALSLFKDASTPEQKNKLLDLAIFALGGDPAHKPGGMTSLSSPKGSHTGPLPHERHAHHRPSHHHGPDHHHVPPGRDNGAPGQTPAPTNGSGPGNGSGPSNGSAQPLTVSGNTVDTGRYQISASTEKDGQVKIFDKQTNSFVEAFGDPHLLTSDGDKANFHKNGLSIKLPDGTTVHLKPTAVNDKGVAWLDGAMVEKDGKAVTMTGMHAPGGVKTSDVKTATDDMVHDYTTQGQTVLDASDQDVGDLFMTGPDGQRTTELKSPDKETSLDGMGGALNGSHHSGETTRADTAKGSQFKVDCGLLDKLGQVLHLSATNVSDRATQQGLLTGIQDVLQTFISPTAHA